MLKTVKTILYRETLEAGWKDGVLLETREGAEFIADAETGKVLTSFLDFFETGKTYNIAGTEKKPVFNGLKQNN